MSSKWWNGAVFQALFIVLTLVSDGWVQWAYGFVVLLTVIDFAFTSRLAYWQRQLIEAIDERKQR